MKHLKALLILLIPTMAFAGLPDVPLNAKSVIPLLIEYGKPIWPDADFALLAAEMHKETCITEKHPFCFSPTAHLKTAREEGGGLGQFTRTAKMDVVAELRAQFPQYLANWDWDRDFLNVKYQIQAMVLKQYYNWSRITDAKTEIDRKAFMLLAYNAGGGRVISDRRVCRATPECDSDVWIGNVENTSMLKSVAKAQGYGETFYQITRRYVREILLTLRPRYEAYLGTLEKK